MPREHDFRGIFMGSGLGGEAAAKTATAEREEKVKKRVLAIMLALCIAAVNTAGVYAASAEGTAQQEELSAEEGAEEVTKEEVTGPEESVEDALGGSGSEQADEEAEAIEAGSGQEDGSEPGATADEAQEADQGDTAEAAQGAEAEETVEEQEEDDTDAEPAQAVEEWPEEDKAVEVAAAEELAEPDGEKTEIIEDVDPTETLRAAMEQAVESYIEIGDGNEAAGAISGSAVTNMNKLISYINKNGKSYDGGIKGILLDPVEFDGGQYMPMILLDSSEGLVVFAFSMLIDGSSQSEARVYLYYSIGDKEFEGLHCIYEGTGYGFESYADIKEETYLRDQELNFTLQSVEGFTDAVAYDLSETFKNTAFIAYEGILQSKVGLTLYALGFQKYIIMDRVECRIPSGTYVHTGSAVKPSVKVTYYGSALKQGVHYKLTYKNNTNVGRASVTVTAIGGLSGSVTLTFSILPAATKKVTIYNVAQGLKVTWLKVPGANRYKVYRDGRVIKITSGLEITDGYVKSSAGKKFTYKVVAMAKDLGDSTVSRTGTYYRLIPVGIKSVTNPGPGQMTVTYDKSAGSSGYVVRYGLKSDMSDAKVITVQGAGTLSRTFNNLTKGKTYYVQVRTYKIDNGVRYYSGYCTTKRVTITK